MGVRDDQDQQFTLQLRNDGRTVRVRWTDVVQMRDNINTLMEMFSRLFRDLIAISREIQVQQARLAQLLYVLNGY